VWGSLQAVYPKCALSSNVVSVITFIDTKAEESPPLRCNYRTGSPFLAHIEQRVGMAYQPKDFLRRSLDAWVNGFTHPGAVVGMFDRDGKEIFYHEANSTKRGLEGEQAVNYSRETIFRIYSMTKPIAAVAALILVERGLLSVSDEVGKWIPAFNDVQVYVSGEGDTLKTEKPSSPMTVFHLLTHTAGLVYGLTPKTVPDKVLQSVMGTTIMSAMRTKSADEFYSLIAQAPLLFHPGTKFEYGLNTDVLGRIIELASGQPLDTFLQEEILGPLGMVDTAFYVPPDKLHRLAKCYVAAPGMAFKEAPQPPHNESFAVSPAVFSAGGGLLSTLDDYARFTTFLLNEGAIVGTDGRILRAESVAYMTSNVLPDGADIHDIAAAPGFLEVEGGGYGFGLSVYVLTDPTLAQGGILSGRGEFGWGGFASTAFFVDPSVGMSCILMTQLMPSNLYPIRSHLRYMSHWVLQEERRLAENGNCDGNPSV
jgi:CubicO group peptidase (beta-lactamase class C family)